jgi:hypothetical protein
METQPHEIEGMLIERRDTAQVARLEDRDERTVRRWKEPPRADDNDFSGSSGPTAAGERHHDAIEALSPVKSEVLHAYKVQRQIERRQGRLVKFLNQPQAHFSRLTGHYASVATIYTGEATAKARRELESHLMSLIAHAHMLLASLQFWQKPEVEREAGNGVEERHSGFGWMRTLFSGRARHTGVHVPKELKR